MSKFGQFKSETDGNVAMMFAATAVMLLTGIGAAIDFSNLSQAKSELQAQVDGAVLAAATVKIDSDNADNEQSIRTQIATEVLTANGFDGEVTASVLTIHPETVVLKAEVDYRPFFGGFLGVDTIRLTADSESGLPGTASVDIAMVIDSTYSMSVDGKLDALKDGATKLVEAIEESNSESKISLVPFSRYVHLNDSVRTASWFQMPVESFRTRTYQQATHTGGTCTDEIRTRTRDGIEEEYTRSVCVDRITTYEDAEQDIKSEWLGCAGTRATPYSESDDFYVHKIPGLLKRLSKEESGLSRDVWTECPSEIVPLTDDYETLKSEIGDLITIDNTYLPAGLIWGQRVLSPGEPFDNNIDPGDEGKRRVLVLMTDGNNTTEIMEDAASVANFKAPPYIADVDSDDVAYEANAATARLCANIKSDGIEIYTIAFQVTDAATSTLLRNCASSPDNALTAASNSQLVAEFQGIAKALQADIRLIR